MDGSSSVCKMCLISEAKYTCPRCNMGYCSVACYQSEKHSSCSETFYKECVVNELSEITNDPEDKQKVLEMLAKDLEEKAEDDVHDSSDEELADRLEGLDLDKDISVVWGRLKPKEKEDFARMLQDGRLARLIELWTPWWRSSKNQKLVMEKESAEKADDSQMPDILSNIPDINLLLKNNRPSSECKFDLLNVLMSYAYVTRVHNGCHLECPMDSAQDVLSTCFVLKDQNRCGSVGEAVQKSFDAHNVQKNKSENSPLGFNITVLEDVKLILSGPGKSNSFTFISAALSDLIKLLQSALKIIKKELKDRLKSEEKCADLTSMKSAVFKAEKKVSFLLSWTQRFGVAAQKLIPHLQFELETRKAEIQEVDEMKTAISNNMDKLKPKDEKLQTEDDASISKIVELN